MWRELEVGSFIAFASGLIFGVGLIIATSAQWQPLLLLASVAAGIFLYRWLLLPRVPVTAKIDPAGSSAGG